MPVDPALTLESVLYRLNELDDAFRRHIDEGDIIQKCLTLVEEVVSTVMLKR